MESTCADDLEKGANRRSEINSPDAARNNLNEEASFQTSSQTRPNNDDLNQTSNYPTLRVKTDLEATEINNEENDIPMDPGDSEEADKCQDFTATDLLEPKMEVMEQEVSDEERSNFQSYFNENNALANPNPFATLQGKRQLLKRLSCRNLRGSQVNLCCSVSGNIDLMAGMNSELRDENAEGKYASCSHPHLIDTHKSSRTAAPPANLCRALVIRDLI